MLRTGVHLSNKIQFEAKVRPCEKMAMPVSESHELFKVGMCFLDCVCGSVSKIANSSELAVCLKAVVFRIMVDAFQIHAMSFSFTCYCYFF